MTVSSADRENLIRKLHDSPVQGVLAVTGGGSLVISDLLCVPGASRTVIEATVPYASAALADFLQATPEQFCAEPAARNMAATALARAERLQPDANRASLVGLACTASLASDRPKRGEHRAHLALHSLGQTLSRTLRLAKEHRVRAVEERLVADALLNLLAEAAGIPQRVPLALVDTDRWEARNAVAPAAWRELMLGHTQRAAAGASRNEPPQILFPGSFNPLHQGHRQMAAYAEQRLATTVDFELSILNVDKPALDYIAIEDRVAQFTDRRIWLTRAPTFLEKAQLFPGATFLVGVDTIRRIGQPHYYGDSVEATRQAIEQLATADVRFLVFGRAGGEQFLTLSDLCLPSRLAALCEEVPEEAFRQDVSSTALRLQARASAD